MRVESAPPHPCRRNRPQRRRTEGLRLQRAVGRLVRGFAGDLILVDGTPLADVSVLKTPPYRVRAGLTHQPCPCLCLCLCLCPRLAPEAEDLASLR
ncbi:hypothetical protein ACIODT_23745 [Streptomyces sp. NPDC088251]|uniref:hypothetical protein n=1 Tax=unclassified Streptomyces TaxID=2593676 RepID=UPI0037FF5ECC